MKKGLIVAVVILSTLFGLIWLGGRDRINAYRQELWTSQTLLDTAQKMGNCQSSLSYYTA